MGLISLHRHWSINGRFLSQTPTGVQRYCERIVRGLDQLVAESHPAVSGLSFDILVPSAGTRTIPLQKIPMREVRELWGHAWEQFVLPFHLQGGLLSLGNTGPVTVRKQIVCIHDANVWIYPESYSRAFRTLYKLLLPALGRCAGAITTVSDYSASQLAHFGITGSTGSSVIANGHEHVHDWTPSRSEALSAVGGRNTIILLGSPAPHKNAAVIIGLANELASRGISIAIVGARDPRVFGHTTAGVDAQNIHWLGRISDNELAALLSESLCLVFPSHTEGFGLPAVEAMALGCPVILSDSSSLPEVGGDAALYASPLEPREWLACIDRLRGNFELRSNLVERAKQRVEMFSWRKSAIRYAELMRDMDC